MFLRNTWYPCAWSNEVGRGLLERWICDEPVVFYRTEAGGRSRSRTAARTAARRCPRVNSSATGFNADTTGWSSTAPAHA